MYLVPLSNLPSLQGLAPAGEQNQQAQQAGKPSFSNIMQQAIETLEQTQQVSAQDSYNLAMGDIGDLHTMMINTVMETAAIETAVQVTSRAVSAYKEILQMQI